MVSSAAGMSSPEPTTEKENTQWIKQIESCGFEVYIFNGNIIKYDGLESEIML